MQAVLVEVNEAYTTKLVRAAELYPPAVRTVETYALGRWGCQINPANGIMVTVEAASTEPDSRGNTIKQFA